MASLARAIFSLRVAAALLCAPRAERVSLHKPLAFSDSAMAGFPSNRARGFYITQLEATTALA